MAEKYEFIDVKLPFFYPSGENFVIFDHKYVKSAPLHSTTPTLYGLSRTFFLRLK